MKQKLPTAVDIDEEMTREMEIMRSVKAERDEFKRLLEMKRFMPRDDIGRLLLAAHMRLLEIAADGVPTTPYPTVQNQ